ncbi:hypothetical protein EYF80_021199 [Liparis tanakae]|uniref:Uncharacterized protein n=1 Tax=Liparis tanakae TaxID=230148 RepID=A0A4Z2HUC2_9TELE|nr:hypothetical protein EYF80_021199 [Liparis tanakae]
MLSSLPPPFLHHPIYTSHVGDKEPRGPAHLVAVHRPRFGRRRRRSDRLRCRLEQLLLLGDLRAAERLPGLRRLPGDGGRRPEPGGRRALPAVPVLGVEAADGGVVARDGQGASVHHLANQHGFLGEDDLGLLVGQRQIRLLVGEPTQLHQAADRVMRRLGGPSGAHPSFTLRPYCWTKSDVSSALRNISIRTMSSTGNAVDLGPTVWAMFKMLKAFARTWTHRHAQI